MAEAGLGLLTSFDPLGLSTALLNGPLAPLLEALFEMDEGGDLLYSGEPRCGGSCGGSSERAVERAVYASYV